MTATDELRRLLDERGVEWDADDEIMDDGSISQVTYWYSNDIEWSADGRDEYLAFDAVQLITPAQAIAATLGRRKCRNVHEPPKDTTFWPAPHFRCSVCGKAHVSTDYVYFCPNCGAEVDEVGDERNDV